MQTLGQNAKIMYNSKNNCKLSKHMETRPGVIRVGVNALMEALILQWYIIDTIVHLDSIINGFKRRKPSETVLLFLWLKIIGGWWLAQVIFVSAIKSKSSFFSFLGSWLDFCWDLGLTIKIWRRTESRMLWSLTIQIGQMLWSLLNLDLEFELAHYH